MTSERSVALWRSEPDRSPDRVWKTDLPDFPEPFEHIVQAPLIFFSFCHCSISIAA